jgi:hypothetical protein
VMCTLEDCNETSVSIRGGPCVDGLHENHLLKDSRLWTKSEEIHTLIVAHTVLA